MSQNAKQSNTIDFTVASEALFTADGANSGWLANRRTDNGAVLGVTSDRYGIIQNADLISCAEDAFAKRGMTNYTRKTVSTGAGEKMYVSYDFKDNTKKLKVGDEVGMRLTLQNSFDRTLRASFAIGMLRLRCLNGMTTLEKEVGMTKKHHLNINVDFIAKSLDKAVQGFDRSTAVFDRLAEVAVTQEQGIYILSHLEEDGVVSGKVREGIQAVWNAPKYREDEARNLWNLYNAMTQHVTHEIADTRFELANRVSDGVLHEFARASRDGSRLAKLMMPIALPDFANN